MSDGAETPLIDLLRDVPEHARALFEVSQYEHRNIPYGRLCNKAADRIEQLERERDELRRELEPLRELAAGRCTIQKVIDQLGPMTLWSKAALDAEIERRCDELRRDSERLTKIFSAVEWYGHGYWLPDWFLGAVSTAHAPPTKEELCAAIDAMKGESK